MLNAAAQREPGLLAIRWSGLLCNLSGFIVSGHFRYWPFDGFVAHR